MTAPSLVGLLGYVRVGGGDGDSATRDETCALSHDDKRASDASVSENIVIFVHQVVARDRRQGVGSSLLSSALESNEDACSVILVVHRDNVDAVRFYEHLGFKNATEEASDVRRLTRALNVRISHAESLMKVDACDLKLNLGNAFASKITHFYGGLRLYTFKNRRMFALDHLSAFKQARSLLAACDARQNATLPNDHGVAPTLHVRYVVLTHNLP
jgi:GNAT superfamily N-acetyltransferase